ncbi:MAG: phosphoribosylanthranilate isomerase [Pseudomonadota bacterium]
MALEVKICGLTNPDQAVACAEAGARAVGLVFYPKSPRFVDRALAREICRAVGGRAKKVGVFVNEPVEKVLSLARFCGLDLVQLHGAEPPEEVAAIEAAGVKVVKALFANREPGFAEAARYGASGFLVECAGGALPGGNALAWDWSTARGAGAEKPLVLAGGLCVENLPKAVEQARPRAVDVSSGVEASPGIKDLTKVREFLAAAALCRAPGGEGIFS